MARFVSKSGFSAWGLLGRALGLAGMTLSMAVIGAGVFAFLFLMAYALAPIGPLWLVLTIGASIGAGTPIVASLVMGITRLVKEIKQGRWVEETGKNNQTVELLEEGVSVEITKADTNHYSSIWQKEMASADSNQPVAGAQPQSF